MNADRDRRRDQAEVAIRGARFLLREAGKLLDADGETVRHNVTMAQVAADDAVDAVVSARATDVVFDGLEKDWDERTATFWKKYRDGHDPLDDPHPDDGPL